MNDAIPPHEHPFPEARVKKRRFSAVWLIPIIAALIAGYLGVRSYSEHGPVVTLTFRTAEGLSVGQTAVKYKSVTLGTIDNISLTKDRSGVVVRVRMQGGTDDLLTDHARFWIERPRLSTVDLSDIVAGTFIALDPGAPGGSPQTHFTGLETHPALPADEPGAVFILSADRIGAITEGSPVYFHDTVVGKILGYDIGDGSGPTKLSAFVRAPYDKFVKPTSRFWNASGFSVKLGAGGLHVQLQSLQTVLSGGVAFDTPPADMQQPAADAKSAFVLYEDRKLADAASYIKRQSYVTYVQTAIKDLAKGSPVQIFGVPVGEVADVKLIYNPGTSQPRVRVAFVIEPERAFGGSSDADPAQIMRQLVQNGMRVKMESSDLIAGQEILALEFAPRTEPAEIATEGDAIVLPGQGGGIDDIAGALGDVAAKLNAIPFDEIGANLNHLIGAMDKNFGGPDMQHAVHDLAQTLANAKDISQDARENLGPALRKLPDISAQLQNAVAQANAFLSSVNSGYGQDSDFQRDAKHTLDEAGDAARSIRLLADYLERHPEALLQGKQPDADKGRGK